MKGPLVNKVRAAIKKFPDAPNRTIARYLRETHPRDFQSIDQARNAVCYHRGNRGDAHRKRLSDKSLVRPNGKAGEVRVIKGHKPNRTPIKMTPGKWLIISDLHCPYHDNRAIDRAINYGVQENCQHLYINGDAIDFHRISRWEQDPESRGTADEVFTARRLLEQIKEPFAERWYKVGNHDERLEKYIVLGCPELMEFLNKALQQILMLEEFGYQFVPSSVRADFGKLPVYHGHEVKCNSPVNPARGLWNKVQGTCAMGHLHRSSSHAERLPLKSRNETCWSIGCLCDMSPQFAVVNKWNLGFAIADTQDNGDFDFQNFQISDDSKKVWRA